jgi:hypothetical protein
LDHAALFSPVDGHVALRSVNQDCPASAIIG